VSYIYLPDARANIRSSRIPWPLLLFVTSVLFLAIHWPLQIHDSLSDYNNSQEIIVAGIEGSAGREVMLITLLIAAIGSLVSRPSDPQLRFQGLIGWGLIAFLGWAVLSAIWAEDFLLTVTRLVSFVILCVFAVAVARRLSLREILLWTFFTTALFFSVAIAAELMAGIFRPGVYGYRFSGIQHPNGEGVECALLTLSAFAAAHTEKKHRRLFASLGAVGVLFMLLTASRTSLGSTLLACAAYGLIVSRGRARGVAFGCAGAVVALVLLLNTAGAFDGLESKLFPGRDEGGVHSLAGRTTIWADVAPFIHQRPLTGYGFGGFWTAPHIYDISDEEEWGVPDGHSAYIDYLLTLGAVGLVIYVLCLCLGIARALILYRKTLDARYAFALGLLVFGTVNGFLESQIGQGSLLTLVCVVVLIKLAFVPVPAGGHSLAASGSREAGVFVA
jgi:exopolysaccharide production protein ExoQ